MKNIAITLLIFVSCRMQAQIIYEENIKAPELKFTEWIENAKGSAILQDKHIVLEFWATWCGGCIAAIPHMNELTRKYSDQISFISVNSHDTRLKVEKFLERTELVSYKAMDSNKYLKEALKVQTIPATFLIDSKGKLRWKGYASDLTEELINVFLEEDRIIDLTENLALIDEKIVIKNPNADIRNEISVSLNLERRIYDQMQSASTSVSYDYQDSFFFDVRSFSISNALITLFASPIEDLDPAEWDYEILGEEPKQLLNLKVLSNWEYDEELIVSKVIERIGLEFNCKLDILEREVDLWVMESNEECLKPFLSKLEEVNDSSTKYDKLAKERKTKNMSLEELSSLFSGLLKEKIIYESSNDNLYDLGFKFDENTKLNSLREELLEKYEIILAKRKKKIKVISLSFL